VVKATVKAKTPAKSTTKTKAGAAVKGVQVELLQSLLVPHESAQFMQWDKTPVINTVLN
jgi:hypothetical protein